MEQQMVNILLIVCQTILIKFTHRSNFLPFGTPYYISNWKHNLNEVTSTF